MSPTAWQYNPFAEPLDYSAAINNAEVYHYTFERDLLGRISKKTERIEGVTTITDYVYDLAGRLDTVTVDGVLRSDYNYDANSNRAQVTYRDAAGNPSVRSGSFDAQDRMQSYGPWTYQYDPNGELAQRTETASGDITDYLYDEFGNLRAVDLPDGREIRYQDDAFNRRTVKTIDGVEVQRFAYMNQLDPVAELNPSGTVIATYAYAERGHSPSLMRKAGQTYRILTDHLGSIRLVVDVATGTIVQRMDYDEFGRVTQDTNPGFQPFGYAGGIYDRDTGLVRFGARDYDAESGRWATKDPIGFGGGTTLVYEYVASDPINYIDSSGNSLVRIAVSVVGCVLSASGGYDASVQFKEDLRQIENDRAEKNRSERMSRQDGSGDDYCDTGQESRDRLQDAIKVLQSGSDHYSEPFPKTVVGSVMVGAGTSSPSGVVGGVICGVLGGVIGYNN